MKKQQPELKIEMRPVVQLIPYALNAKDHPEEQIAALAGLIREIGFRVPLAIDVDGSIIAGHGRLLAARRLGLAEVPVIVHGDLSEREKRAMRIADNRLGELAATNTGNLAAELRDLADSHFNLQLVGYTDTDLAELEKAAEDVGGGEPDAPPELPGCLLYKIVVNCRDEEQQAELMDKFESEGLKCQPLIS